MSSRDAAFQWMMVIYQRRILILIVWLAVGLIPPTNAQTIRWAKLQDKPLIKFDWNCSSRSAYPSAKLNRIVKLVMQRNEFGGFGSWADRAFAFDLNGDRKLEIFVPLDCGATGNCVWGVFAVNPVRDLGLITGEYIYVHRLKGHWPELVSYAHLSAVEGSLTTYRFGRGHYLPTGSNYPINHGSNDLDIQGGAGNEMPPFLKNARSACQSLGS